MKRKEVESAIAEMYESVKKTQKISGYKAMNQIRDAVVLAWASGVKPKCAKKCSGNIDAWKLANL